MNGFDLLALLGILGRTLLGVFTLASPIVVAYFIIRFMLGAHDARRARREVEADDA